MQACGAVLDEVRATGGRVDISRQAPLDAQRQLKVPVPHQVHRRRVLRPARHQADVVDVHVPGAVEVDVQGGGRAHARGHNLAPPGGERHRNIEILDDGLGGQLPVDPCRRPNPPNFLQLVWRRTIAHTIQQVGRRDGLRRQQLGPDLEQSPLAAPRIPPGPLKSLEQARQQLEIPRKVGGAVHRVGLRRRHRRKVDDGPPGDPLESANVWRGILRRQGEPTQSKAQQGPHQGQRIIEQCFHVR